MSDLEILLTAETSYTAGKPIAFKGTYKNVGTKPIALTFWWNRSGRLVDAAGKVVAPQPGPVLPCGLAESWMELPPGQSIERDEPLGCTQPAGRREAIGWSYAPPPGSYRFTLIYESPPPHGFMQSAAHPSAFKGRVESGEVTFVVK